MTTESSRQEALLPKKNQTKRPSAPARFWHRLNSVLEMPPPELSTLPETWIARTGIPSWPLATLTIGVAAYLAFVLVALADGTFALITEQKLWWSTLLLPAIGTYLVMIQPLLRTRLTKTLDAYRALAPFNDRLQRLEMETYTLRRRDEWLALILATLFGWFFMESFIQTGPLTGPVTPAPLMFDILGDVLVFGFTGWHIYAALFRTRRLSVIHDHVQNLTMFRQSVPYRHIVLWSAVNAAVLFGGIVVSAIFLSPAEMYQPPALIVYGTLTVAAILIFAFSRVPASILNQFRVFRAFFLFVAVAVVGTIGYSHLEGWAWEDSLYATVITMTTIGYGDYSPVTMEGRRFTIFLSLFAIGIGGYAVTSLASFVIEGNFSRLLGRRVDKKIVQMHGHHIVCGAGKIGRQLAIEFYRTRVPFVVIEQDSEVLENLLREVEIPYVHGDATQDESLRLAGVERASGLVAALSDDKDNVFITLSARALNPELRIVARLTVENNRKKLEKAGADQVISPNEASGRRMASEMLNSEAVTLLDEMLRAERQTGQTLRLEEVHVSQIKIPALVERLNRGELHITDIGMRTELMVVAVKRGQCGDGEDPYIYTPRGNTRLQRGDVLIVMGTPEQRIRLQHDVLSSNRLGSWLKSVRN
ncbi:MAG: hypothetical protein Kow0031_06330 [Anaerolineae bacterium]